MSDNDNVSYTETEVEEFVTITKDEYDELVSSALFLDALEQAGVDNWEGHGLACDIFDAFKS